MTPGISNRDQDVVVIIIIIIIIIVITVVKSLMIYTPSRQLRMSGDYRILCVLSVKAKTFGQRSFSHAGPLIWKKINFHITLGLHSERHHKVRYDDLHCFQPIPQNPSV